MKKFICLLAALCLCAGALSGCGRDVGSGENAPANGGGAPVSAPTALPEEGEHGETDQSLALDTLPTLEPVVRLEGADEGGGASDGYFDIDAMINRSIENAEGGDAAATPSQPAVRANQIDTSTYHFSALIDTSLGFTFNYPSHWENVPGVYTVCFREAVEPGDFPARVAISAKKLVHSPEGTVLQDELTSYMKMVYKQYDAATFQAGTPNSEDTFLGKQAVSNTYLAYSGETEVKGFVIARAVGRVLYVFHFCATYEDYQAMESLMRYMVNSVELIEE